MDLASLKNIDLKDIVAKLKSGEIADKKLLIQFGVGLCVTWSDLKLSEWFTVDDSRFSRL